MKVILSGKNFRKNNENYEMSYMTGIENINEVS